VQRQSGGRAAAAATTQHPRKQRGVVGWQRMVQKLAASEHRFCRRRCQRRRPLGAVEQSGAATEEKVIKVLRFGDERSVALSQSLCDELEQQNSRPSNRRQSNRIFSTQRLGNSANQEQEALLFLLRAGQRQAVRYKCGTR